MSVLYFVFHKLYRQCLHRICAFWHFSCERLTHNNPHFFLRSLPTAGPYKLLLPAMA